MILWLGMIWFGPFQSFVGSRLWFFGDGVGFVGVTVLRLDAMKLPSVNADFQYSQVTLVTSLPIPVFSTQLPQEDSPRYNHSTY